MQPFFRSATLAMLLVAGLWLMHIDLNVSYVDLTGNAVLQGLAIGLIWVPLTTVTFATLAPQHRGEAAGMYNLSRNIGAAVGISIVTFLLTRNTQVNHALIGEHVNPYNRALYQPDVLAVLSPWTAQGRAAIDQLVTGQATIIAYANDFKLMMILTLAVMPLVFLLKKAKPAKDSDAVMAHD